MATTHRNRVSTHPGLGIAMDKYDNDTSSTGIPGFATYEAGKMKQKIACVRIGKGGEFPLVSAGTSGVSGSWTLASGANGSLTGANSGLTVTASAQNVETTIRSACSVPASTLAAGQKICGEVRVLNADITANDVFFGLCASSDTPITATDGGSALSDVIAIWFDMSADRFKGSVNGNAGTQVDVNVTSTAQITNSSWFTMGIYVEIGASASQCQGHFAFTTNAGVTTTVKMTTAQLALIYAMLTTQPVLLWHFAIKNVENASNYVVIDYLAGEVDR